MMSKEIEVVDIETTVDGGDNLQADSLELSLDVDELMNLLNISEDDDEKRIRKIHKENSIIKKS